LLSPLVQAFLQYLTSQQQFGNVSMQIFGITHGHHEVALTASFVSLDAVNESIDM
jgi:hypothetical protein